MTFFCLWTVELLIVIIVNTYSCNDEFNAVCSKRKEREREREKKKKGGWVGADIMKLTCYHVPMREGMGCTIIVYDYPQAEDRSNKHPS